MSRSAPSAGPRIRHAPAALALVVTALAATPAHGGLLETSDPTASIRFAADVPRPEVLDEGLDDFSLLFWLRLPDDEPDTSRIITAGDAFTIGLGSDRTVVMRFDGKPDALKVALALDDLPADGAWLLVGCTIDTYNGRLDGWVRSDGGLAHASDGVVAPTGHAGWDGGRGWPITLGAAEGAPAFAGHLGLLVIRDHAIDADDVEHIWRDGEPHYFTPAMGTSGNLTGYGGIVWMTGHGVATDPRSGVNADADRGEIDGRIDANNVLVYSAADGDVANYFNAGLVDEVVGDWTFRSPHDPQRPWSGFFERELPDLVLPEPAYVAQPSPLARRLAADDPTGLIRVITSANSRAARANHSYDAMENWAHGGLYLARHESLAGVIVPVWRDPCVRWPAFDCGARCEGDVNDSATTPYPSAAFGNFGSHGVESNPSFPGYALIGNAVVIEHGASYVPKARPVPGTRFEDPTEPLTVRAMTLRFPGSGAVMYQPEKAKTQRGSGTLVGHQVTQPLDTTVAVRQLTTGDLIAPDDLRIVLDEPLEGVAVRQACYIADGTGKGGVTMVTGVQGGSATVIDFERWFPVDPDETSVLHFGPVTPHWIGHAWPGLTPDDEEAYRGVRMTAAGGPVVAIFLECFNPDADGFVIGGVGKSGRGYDVQLDRLFSAGGVPYMVGLEADVWLQFFAHQGSEPTSMAAYADRIQAASPSTEIWWCGDPDLDVDGGSTPIDEWHEYILDEAAAAGVGAVNAHNHPAIGIGNERAVDGHCANRGHLSGRGNEKFMEAVFDVLLAAALQETQIPCVADFNGDGTVSVIDLVLLIESWGADEPQVDLAPAGGDGVIDTLDLAALLQEWGDCP